MPTITANGTTLYYERRGDGPPLLFISGARATPATGPRSPIALADEYTVRELRPARATRAAPAPRTDTMARSTSRPTTPPRCSRRSTSRPPWSTATARAGSSWRTSRCGARTCCAGAFFHEPAYRGHPGRAGDVRRTPAAPRRGAWREGGPPRAMEMFLRWADGDEVYESLDPDFRDRMLGDGEVLFGLEMRPGLSRHAHVRTARRRSRCPAPSSRAPTTGIPAATHHWAYEAAQWVGRGPGRPARRDARAPTGR